jgi:hypothetical protein
LFDNALQISYLTLLTSYFLRLQLTTMFYIFTTIYEGVTMSQQGTVMRGVVGLAVLLSMTSYGMQRSIMRDEAGFKVMNNGELPSVHALGDAKGYSLCRDSRGFFARKAGEEHRIEQGDISKSIRSMDPFTLNKFLVANYLLLRKNKQHFSVDSQGRLKAGGPWLAFVGATTVWVGGTAATLVATVSAASTGVGFIPALGIMSAGLASTAAAGTKTALVLAAMPTP